jgi:predicted Zn-dependent protease
MSATPIDHDQAVAQVRELLDRRRLRAARDVLANALPRYPNSVSLLQCAAWADWLDDDLDGALESIAKILQADPHDFDARFLLSRIQAEQTRFADAEKTVLGLLQEHPEEPALYAHYGRIMLQTFHLEKAQRLASEALRRDPSNVDALNVDVLCAFIDSSSDEQRARLQRLLREYPDQAQSTVRVVQLLIDHGKHREAYELARELVMVDPGNAGLVDLAAELRRTSHWSMWPLWPMRKWGWAGSIGIWAIAMVLLRSNALQSTPLAGYDDAVALVFLGYVIYSWVWPPVLGRLLR